MRSVLRYMRNSLSILTNYFKNLFFKNMFFNNLFNKLFFYF